MAARKRKADSKLSDSLFDPHKDEQKSLTASLFGESSETSNGKGIFETNTQHLDDAVSNRKRANMAMLAKVDETHTDDKKDIKKSESAQEILDRRKLQGSGPLLALIECSTVIDSVPRDVRARETADVVRSHGFVVAKNIIPTKLLETLAEQAEQHQKKVTKALDEKAVKWRDSDGGETFRYHEAASRCRGRMDLRLDSSYSALGSSEVIENELLLLIVNELLGGKAASDQSHLPKLVYAGLILSLPGSDDQPWHQDGMPLFGELDGAHLPPYALNFFIPLSESDIGVAAGPTEFIAGSHLMMEDTVMNVAEGKKDPNKIVGPLLEVGDVLIYDYRVCHRGTSNLTHNEKGVTGKVRKILYLMFARPWFREHLNFGESKLFD